MSVQLVGRLPNNRWNKKSPLQCSSSELQLGLITNTLLIHPSAQSLTLVGHAQQVLRWDQRSWPVLWPLRDPLASMLFVTAILLIQLEPEERSETPDKRFSAMRTVHGRASEAKGRLSDRPSPHKCTNVPSPWRSQMGWRGRRSGGCMGWRWTKETFFYLFFFLKKGSYWTPVVWQSESAEKVEWLPMNGLPLTQHFIR